MVHISFESNFSYTSRLATDFDIDAFTIRLTEDATDPANADVLATTETVSDLSVFAESDEVNITHQSSLINYSGALDNSIVFDGVTYDLIYNPIMLTSEGTSSRYVAFTAQNSVSGETRRMLYRESFGTNPTATPLFINYDNDGVEVIQPGVNSASNSTSSTRFYWTSSTPDPEIFYNRYKVSGASDSQTEIGDIADSSGSNPDNYTATGGSLGITTHSWADTSYTVLGSGGFDFGLIGVNHSGSFDGGFVVDHQSSNGTVPQAVASARVEDDLYVIAFGNLYKYVGDLDFNQAGDKLDHNGTPGELNPTVEGTYTGYYFTRMFYDKISQALYLVGDTGTTGNLPGNFNSQKVYKTDLTLSSITEVGTFDIGYRTNTDVFNIPDSQLYMFPGTPANILFDAGTEEVVDTRARIQDGGGLFLPANQWMGGFKVSRAATIGYLSILKSPSNLQDYLNPEFAFTTITNF